MSSFRKWIEIWEDEFGSGTFGAKKHPMIRMSRKQSSISSKIYNWMGKGIFMNRLSSI
jgi:hypothetical protein